MSKIDELFPKLNAIDYVYSPAEERAFECGENSGIDNCKQALVGKVWLKVGVEEIKNIIGEWYILHLSNTGRTENNANILAQKIVDYLEGVSK